MSATTLIRRALITACIVLLLMIGVAAEDFLQYGGHIQRTMVYLSPLLAAFGIWFAATHLREEA